MITSSDVLEPLDVLPAQAAPLEKAHSVGVPDSFAIENEYQPPARPCPEEKTISLKTTSKSGKSGESDMTGQQISKIAKALEGKMADKIDVVLGGSTATALHANVAGENHRTCGDLDFVARDRAPTPGQEKSGATTEFITQITKHDEIKKTTQRVLSTDVKTKQGKPVDASFKKPTDNGTVQSRDFPISLDEKIEVSIKDSQRHALRCTKIDGVLVPTKQELIATRQRHDPRPHKVDHDRADLILLVKMQQDATKRGHDMLSQNPLPPPSKYERTCPRQEDFARSSSLPTG